MSSGNMKNEGSLADLVTNHVSAMLAYWDKDLVCRFANNAYIEWFGKSREEMINNITLDELVGPDMFQLNLPYVEGAIRGEPQTFEREIPLPSGDGSRFAMANYFPNIVDGKVDGFYVHAADISSIKLAEKALLASDKIIKEQNKRLLGFANVVTHNLKSHAYNLTGVLEMFVAAKSDEEEKELLGFLKEIVYGFNSTIENLAEVAAVQNNSTLKLDIVDLHDYINKAVGILRMDIQHTRATIHNLVDPGTTLYANRAYLDSIILNFLTNAIKYRHPDRDPEITLSANVTDEKLELSIADNGLGINLAAYGNKLFGLYKTFHGNPDAKGVGLYLVKSQVEALGGHIEVQSEVGKGTTFKVCFLQIKK